MLKSETFQNKINFLLWGSFILIMIIKNNFRLDWSSYPSAAPAGIIFSLCACVDPGRSDEIISSSCARGCARSSHAERRDNMVSEVSIIALTETWTDRFPVWLTLSQLLERRSVDETGSVIDWLIDWAVGWLVSPCNFDLKRSLNVWATQSDTTIELLISSLINRSDYSLKHICASCRTLQGFLLIYPPRVTQCGRQRHLLTVCRKWPTKIKPFSLSRQVESDREEVKKGRKDGREERKVEEHKYSCVNMFCLHTLISK